MGRNLDSYCRYHRTDGHTTDDFWTLKQQIEQLIQKGASKKYTKEGELSDGKRRKGSTSRRQETTREKGQEGAQRTTEHETADKGGINSIAGGFSGGGATPLARKRYVKSIMTVGNNEDSVVQEYPGITFELQDFNGVRPHSDDPIVISVTTSGFRIAKVLIDGGSSANVIFGGCFDELKPPPSVLKDYPGT